MSIGYRGGDRYRNPPPGARRRGRHSRGPDFVDPGDSGTGYSYDEGQFDTRDSHAPQDPRAGPVGYRAEHPSLPDLYRPGGYGTDPGWTTGGYQASPHEAGQGQAYRNPLEPQEQPDLGDGRDTDPAGYQPGYARDRYADGGEYQPGGGYYGSLDTGYAGAGGLPPPGAYHAGYSGSASDYDEDLIDRGEYQPNGRYSDGGGYRAAGSYGAEAGYPGGVPDSGVAGYPGGVPDSGVAGYPDGAGYPALDPLPGRDDARYAGEPGFGPEGGWTGLPPAASGERPGSSWRAGPGARYDSGHYELAEDAGHDPGADDEGYDEAGRHGRRGERRYEVEFIPGLDDGRAAGRGGRSGRAGRTGRVSKTGRGSSGDRDSQPGRPRWKRRHRVGRVAAPLIAIVVAVAALGAIGYGGLYLYHRLHSPDYQGPGYGEVTVQVHPGDNAYSIAPELVKLGVVASTRAFENAAKSYDPTGLEPGYFRLHKHMNALLAWKLLLNPNSRIQATVAVPDGMRAVNIIALLAAKTGQPLSAFKLALADTKALGLPSYANGNPEGYLYPATYNFAPGTTPLKMLQTMVAQFKEVAAQMNLAAKARAAHFTAGQVITEASILEAEVGPAYYTRVARVIDNRLNIGMRLQLDSTVLYALHRTGAVSDADTQVSSPYNTYLHPGLPPGPIDSPDEAAINAVLHPAPRTDTWLYYLTVNLKTGLTKFTSSSTVFDQLKAACQARHQC
jgi:UPF0755 protein